MTQEPDAAAPAGAAAHRSDVFPGIQLLRAAAALMVVWGHAILVYAEILDDPSTLDDLGVAGTSGVDIFFVISGFVIFRAIHAAPSRQTSPAAFLRRRAARIFPLYWLVLGGVVATIALGLRDQPLSAAGLAKAILLLPVDEPVVNVSWTLSYELFFYLLFAATLPFRRRLASLILPSMAILGCIAVAPVFPAGTLRTFLGYEVMLEFCYGLGLGYAVTRWPLMPLPPVRALLPLFALLVGSTWLLEHDQTYAPAWRSIKWGLTATAIVAAAVRVRHSEGRTFRLGLLLGDASYAIYVCQVFVIAAYGNLLRGTELWMLPQAPVIALVVATAAIGGVAVHRWFERPLAAILRPARSAA